MSNESVRHGKEQVKLSGNLKEHIQFWRDICTSQLILRVIEEGY